MWAVFFTQSISVSLSKTVKVYRPIVLFNFNTEWERISRYKRNSIHIHFLTTAQMGKVFQKESHKFLWACDNCKGLCTTSVKHDIKFYIKIPLITWTALLNTVDASDTNFFILNSPVFASIIWSIGRTDRQILPVCYPEANYYCENKQKWLKRTPPRKCHLYNILIRNFMKILFLFWKMITKNKCEPTSCQEQVSIWRPR